MFAVLFLSRALDNCGTILSHDPNNCGTILPRAPNNCGIILAHDPYNCGATLSHDPNNFGDLSMFGAPIILCSNSAFQMIADHYMVNLPISPCGKI